MHEIKAQQDELSRKLNEKISGDLDKFQKAMDDIFKQKQVSQRKYLIEKINRYQDLVKRVIKRVPQAQAHVGRYPDLLLLSIKEIKSGPSMMIY